MRLLQFTLGFHLQFADAQRPTVHRAEHLDVADGVEPELGRDARFDPLDQRGRNLLRLRPVNEIEIGLGLPGGRFRHLALVNAVLRSDNPAVRRLPEDLCQPHDTGTTPLAMMCRRTMPGPIEGSRSRCRLTFQDKRIIRVLN